ncbi:desiccation-related protein isoform X1 [Cinnamomum micranthum f. kanehirae]|uniref:Desiccation-related protein isoform X1 n=1 Tax=Cinnamomum micranthum f. kanehirae TaxID=337451 RepID=A0A3S3P2G8_9MAGN|nr:desiccation-related protein isoform X1 [Cinnamomum micranthum f. kanehirae]
MAASSSSSSSSNQGFLSKIKSWFDKIVEVLQKILGLGTPTAYVSAVRISSIDIKKADLVYDVLVVNPSRISFPLADISYSVESDGRKLVSGSITDAGTLLPKASTTIKMPVTFVYEDILSTFADIKLGSIIPYELGVQFMVTIPIFGKATISLGKTGEIPIPTVPIITLEMMQFEKFGLDECVTVLHLKIINKNEFEMGLTALEYEIALSGITIGSAELAQSAKIDESGVSLINISLSFKPKDFGTALWELLGKTTVTYSLKGSVTVDTLFGTMNLPFSQEGSASLFKST